MTDQAVVLGVASYRSRADATRDLERLRGASPNGAGAGMTAAVVTKGPDGRLEVDQPGMAERLGFGVVLLGSALIVVAAPVGILYLVPLLAGKAAWAGVGAVVGHFWNHVPKARLLQMSEILEASPAAILVVAVGMPCEQITTLLTHTSTAVLADLNVHGLDADLARTIDAA
jgi:uncharacterized membrane protein